MKIHHYLLILLLIIYVYIININFFSFIVIGNNKDVHTILFTISNYLLIEFEKIYCKYYLICNRILLKKINVIPYINLTVKKIPVNTSNEGCFFSDEFKVKNYFYIADKILKTLSNYRMTFLKPIIIDTSLTHNFKINNQNPFTLCN